MNRLRVAFFCFCLTSVALAQEPQTQGIFFALPGINLNLPGLKGENFELVAPADGQPGGLLILLPADGSWPTLSNGQITINEQDFHPLPLSLDTPTPGHPRVLPGQPVEDYSCMQANGQACAVPRSALPVRVYSQFNRPVAQSAAAMWNRTGQKAYGLSFFEVVDSPERAQLTIDWSGSSVPAGADGVTTMRLGSDRVRVRDVSLRTENKTPEQLKEVLGHELGHVLGLDHSENSGDLMYYRVTGNFAKPEADLSQRDAWMVGWLYNQTRTIPMLAGR